MSNLRLCVLLAAISVFAFSGGAAAENSAKGALKGQVLNRTISGKGVGGLEIELHQETAGKKKLIGQTKTDASGSFLFQDVTPAKDMLYSVSTVYKGVAYSSEPLGLNDEGTFQAELVIYDTTDQAHDLYVKMHHIFFKKTEGALQVKEVLIVGNPGNLTIVGAGRVNPMKKDTLRISLPDRATDLRYMPPLEPTESKTGFGNTAPIKPGTSQFVFGYSVPYSKGGYIFSKSLNLKTSAVSVVYFDKDLQIESDRLVAAAARSASGEPVYQLFGKDFAGGSRLTLRLTPAGHMDYFKWIVITALGIFLGMGLVVLSLKRRPNSAGDPDSGADPEPASPAARLQTLLHALAELDDQFESGGLDAETYQRKRGSLMEEARILSREMHLNPEPSEGEKF